MNGDRRPKLPEGFYEVESIRKKRCHKGKTQYLIKWFGWPESTNTWKPVENLISCCAELIDAFEERMRLETQGSSGQASQARQNDENPPARQVVNNIEVIVIDDDSD